MSYQPRYGPNYRSAFGPTMTPAVKLLLIANGVVFVLQFVIGLWFLKTFAFRPLAATIGLQVWQFLTYMFMHGSLGHILINMFSLWMFGRVLEMRWGRDEFLRFYIIAGIGAAVVYLLTAIPGIFLLGTVNPHIPMVGASGAIFGLLLAFAWYHGEQPVYLWFILPIKAKYFVLGLGVLSFFSGVGQLAPGSDVGGGANVAHFAHLGGLLTGWLYLRYGGWSGWKRMLSGRGPRQVKTRRAPRRPYMDDDTWR